MVAGTVITGRGSAVCIFEALEWPVEFRRVSEGSQGSLAFQNNRHSDLIERRSIAIEILNNTAKEIFSEIDRSALSLADREFIRLQSRSAIMRTTNAQPTFWVAMQSLLSGY